VRPGRDADHSPPSSAEVTRLTASACTAIAGQIYFTSLHFTFYCDCTFNVCNAHVFYCYGIEMNRKYAFSL
jgi:hypothetical protein